MIFACPAEEDFVWGSQMYTSRSLLKLATDRSQERKITFSPRFGSKFPCL